MPTLTVSLALAILTLAAQILTLCLVIYFLIFRNRQNKFTDFLQKNGLGLAFLVALIATLGSLYFSEIAGLNPCKLCWLQRIFMYPQVIILGLALIKNDLKIIDYSLSLLAIGAIISLYHNYIIYNNRTILFCSAGIESCVSPIIVELGYITIPLMSLTAFLFSIIILASTKYYREKNKKLLGL